MRIFYSEKNDKVADKENITEEERENIGKIYQPQLLIRRLKVLS